MGRKNNTGTKEYGHTPVLSQTISDSKNINDYSGTYDRRRKKLIDQFKLFYLLTIEGFWSCSSISNQKKILTRKNKQGNPFRQNCFFSPLPSRLKRGIHINRRKLAAHSPKWKKKRGWSRKERKYKESIWRTFYLLHFPRVVYFGRRFKGFLPESCFIYFKNVIL